MGNRKQAVILTNGLKRVINRFRERAGDRQEDEARYERLLNALPEPILIHAEQKIVYVNPALCGLLDMQTQDQLAGKPMAAIVHPDYRDDVMSRNCFDIKELRLAGMTGRIIDVEVTVIPVTYRGKPSRQVMFKDITRHQQAVEALRESEERYRSLVEFSPESIVVHSEGAIVYINPAGAQLVGASGPEEMMGRSILDYVHPKNKHMLATRYRKFVKLGKPSRLVEFKLILKDGKEIDVEAKAVPITYFGKRVVQLLIRDISNRKRAERNKQESEQRHISLLQHNPDAVFMYSKHGNCLEANPAAEEITGYSRAELLRTRPVDKQQTDKASHHFKKALEGESQTFELTILHKDGHPVDLSIKNVPIIINDEVEGIYSIAKDITEAKRAEKELRSTKELLESFVNHTADGIVFVDLQGRVLRVNKAFEKLHGWTEQEVMGRKLPMTPELLLEEAKRLHQKVISGEEVRGLETQKLRKDGSMFDASVTLSPIKDTEGNVVAIVGVERDISERKRMEEAIRESEAKYRLIAENMTDLIAIVDLRGEVQYVSPSSRLILGCDPETLIGDTFFSLVHPDDLEEMMLQFDEMLETQSKSQFEFRANHKNGYWVVLEAHAMPVINPEDQVEMIVVVARDITDRKKTEEILRRTEKLSVVGQLAAGVAHEIRNPLTSLKGFIQLLKSRSNENQHYYEIMLSELERINQIVGEFMLIAKPQSSHFQQRDVLVILQDVISLLDTQAIISNVQIKTEFVLGNPMIHCDENQLKQVFINLLKNAIEAMPHGGEIVVAAFSREHRQLGIRFIDQGVGITKEKIPQLGEPFYTTKEKGTGLGLMVCHKIIAAHKGNIHIESGLNTGTTVEVVLPVTQHPEAAAAK